MPLFHDNHLALHQKGKKKATLFVEPFGPKILISK
jgi:hypothetical protein